MTNQENFCSYSPEKFARMLQKISQCGLCCCCIYSINDSGCFDVNCAFGVEQWLKQEFKKGGDKSVTS